MLICQYGQFFLFSVQQWQIRRSWEQRVLSTVPEAYLERIEDNGTLAWEEKGQEFSLNGDMYDVVRTRTEQGKTVHFAVNDRKEGQLIKTFSRLFKEGPDNGDGSKGSKLTLKFQTNIFTVPASSELSCPSFGPTASGFDTKLLLVSQPRTVIPCPPWA
jgi:hypothetical protein